MYDGKMKQRRKESPKEERKFGKASQRKERTITEKSTARCKEGKIHSRNREVEGCTEG